MFFRTSQKDQDDNIEGLKSEIKFLKQRLEFQMEILNKIPLLEEKVKSLELEKTILGQDLNLFREDFARMLHILNLTIQPGRSIVYK